MTTQRITNGHNGFCSDPEPDVPNTPNTNGSEVSDASDAGVSSITNGAAGVHLNQRRRMNRKKSSPMMPAFMVSAPGKVIVFGEHAAVHGKVRLRCQERRAI